MTAEGLNLGRDTADSRPTSVVIAAHAREVKTALFLAVNAIPTISIVASAVSTSELSGYCHAFRPDYAIVEVGLPGRSLGVTISELRTSNPDTRILLVGDGRELDADLRPQEIQAFEDLDSLMAAFTELGDDAQ